MIGIVFMLFWAAAFYGSVHLDSVLGWVLGFLCIVGFFGAAAMTYVWFLRKGEERQERKEWAGEVMSVELFNYLKSFDELKRTSRS